MVPDITVANYWAHFATQLTTIRLATAGGVIYSDPSSGVACLMDPTIAFHYPAYDTQTTNGGLASGQDVLIPLFIAIAEDNTGVVCPNCNKAAGTPVNQLILTAEEDYFNGHITSQVSINGNPVTAANGGVLDVDMCLDSGTNTEDLPTYHAPSAAGQVDLHKSALFSLSLNGPVLNSSVYVPPQWPAGGANGSTMVIGNHTSAASIGFWTVIPHSMGSSPGGGWLIGTDVIKYTTTWGVNSIGNCTAVKYKDYFTATVTYKVT